LTNGYTPSVGDTFDLLNWTSYTGAFATVNGTNLPGGLVLKPAYQSTGLSFKADNP
jgi:hypothetical protein